jgi:hypothetical protein
MRDRIWISADLAASQDYQKMHRWLSAHDAKECTGGLFTLFYEYHRELVSEIKDELAGLVGPAPGDRIYLIYKDPDDGEVTGMFIFGERGLSPWYNTH